MAMGEQSNIDRPPVLLIDDDPEMCYQVRHLLEAEGYRVGEAGSGRAGLAQVTASAQPLVVLVSSVLEDLSAVTLLGALARDCPLADRHAYVVTTGDREALADTLGLLLARLPIVLMEEPFGGDTLLDCVRSAAAWTRRRPAPLHVPAHAPAPLPDDVSPATPAEGVQPRVGARVTQQLPEGARAVLVVGGEAGIRHFICRLLAFRGGQATPVGDERAARDWLRASPHPRVVVMNAARPEDGLTLLRAAMTEAAVGRHGYVLATPEPRRLPPVLRHLVAEMGVPVVQKPFFSATLCAAVAHMARRPVSA
jgi:CheY-like chemotaxis protein